MPWSPVSVRLELNFVALSGRACWKNKKGRKEEMSPLGLDWHGFASCAERSLKIYGLDWCGEVTSHLAHMLASQFSHDLVMAHTVVHPTWVWCNSGISVPNEI